jgi:16S rRNA (guanine527-N7)-methyltransferase
MKMEKLYNGAKKLGLRLTTGQLEQFRIYYQELVDWNQQMNLTAVTDYEEVQVRHFLDSLTVTMAMTSQATDGSINAIDVGTGAGLPGVPLKILWPAIRLVLLEATVKKAKFLEHLVTMLGLADVEVVVGRAEVVAHEARYRERFDLVLSRAVASLPALAELTLPFCAVGGVFISQKKGDISQEVSQASGVVVVLGGMIREVKRVELEELSDGRSLVVIDKVKATPDKYPRRPGTPVKRPIVS